jgi:hypothetical protein
MPTEKNSVFFALSIDRGNLVSPLSQKTSVTLLSITAGDFRLLSLGGTF